MRSASANDCSYLVHLYIVKQSSKSHNINEPDKSKYYFKLIFIINRLLLTQ